MRVGKREPKPDLCAIKAGSRHTQPCTLGYALAIVVHLVRGSAADAHVYSLSPRLLGVPAEPQPALQQVCSSQKLRPALMAVLAKRCQVQAAVSKIISETDPCHCLLSFEAEVRVQDNIRDRFLPVPSVL